MKLLIRFGIVDIPDERRAHIRVTPRGGGLALVLILIICGPSFEYLINESVTYSSKMVPIVCLISLISFLDDVRTISIVVRLIVHLFCAALFVYFFISPFFPHHHELPFLFNIIALSLGLTAFLNIYNFMDGIDGITAIESIHLTLTILILCVLKSESIINLQLITGVSILVCACSISFLLFNWPPAKVFIGDVGSISFGFLIGLCLLSISISDKNLFVAAGIASLYYLADAGLTILIRLINREKIWQPHLKHFFQKAVKKGMPIRQIVKKIIFCNLLLMLLSISALQFPVFSSVFAIITVALTLNNFT
ncbi:MAG: MraY family glycosyltransferase [Janthinobacterium lividum]